MYASFDFYPWERIDYPQPAQISKFKSSFIQALYLNIFPDISSISRKGIFYFQPFKKGKLSFFYNTLSYS
ncbi:MAG: hypothetical protein DRI36_06235, partial [Caldiserica bacterium]